MRHAIVFVECAVKHQTELTVKLYICGSEKAQKFAGSLPKLGSKLFPFGLRTWEKPLVARLIAAVKNYRGLARAVQILRIFDFIRKSDPK